MPRMILPTGIRLTRTFRTQKRNISCLSWSPNGELAYATAKKIYLCDAALESKPSSHESIFSSILTVSWDRSGSRIAIAGQGKQGSGDVARYDCDQSLQLLNLETVPADPTVTYNVVWSHSGEYLATCGKDRLVRFWNNQSETAKRRFDIPGGRPLHMAWSPSGEMLAIATTEGVQIWNQSMTEQRRLISSLVGRVLRIAWSRDGRMLASAGSDRTIRIWDPVTGWETAVLEGHTDEVTHISFSADGRLLASRSADGRIRIWSLDVWETVAQMGENREFGEMEFHPRENLLAVIAENQTVVQIWELKTKDLTSHSLGSDSVHYANAKIVLLGDTGVGKSGLTIVLTGQPFVPTESTHSRNVWTFDREVVNLAGDREETRETLLWDLAGQPGYRLIHQLHLSEAAVAVVVFDARSETDPFAGVQYWDRALRQAMQNTGDGTVPIKKFLVSARCDRGGIAVSDARLKSTIDDYGFDTYIETSAKTGEGIRELKKELRDSIEWGSMSKTKSTHLFQKIKAFLIQEKKAGQILSSVKNLYASFLRDVDSEDSDSLQKQFDTCIGLVESRGLIRRLSFGEMVLLQPELLDSYASGIVNAAKNEPDGLGTIAEDVVRCGDFHMAREDRITQGRDEQLLLIATIEDLVRFEVALREQTDGGTYLVFPSHLTRKNPHHSDVAGKTCFVDFEGPIPNVYATLVVRLSHSGFFTVKEMWRNAATFLPVSDGKEQEGLICGFSLSETDEGWGQFTLFFSMSVPQSVRSQFETYVHNHVLRRALPHSVSMRPIVTCTDCNEIITDSQLQKRRSRGHSTISCPVCEKTLSIVGQPSDVREIQDRTIPKMNHAADRQRERSAAALIVEGKKAVGEFDVFLCHNSSDKTDVEGIGRWLMDAGILPWLDKWELQPGRRWQPILEEQIGNVKSVAVFVGGNGIGPWQHEELDAFLREFVQLDVPVIPVLLSNAPKQPKLPIFLKGRTWVDFRNHEPSPYRQLYWGITGKQLRGM